MEDETNDCVPEFGAAVRQEFMLRDDVTFLNHGSFGGMPRCVHERQVRYLQEQESHTDLWFRVKLPDYYKAAVVTVAGFIGTSPMDTFLLQNVTKATNTVLKTFPLAPGDAYLITTLTYGAVKMQSQAVTKHVEGTKTYTLDLDFPISSENDIIEKYEDFLKTHPDVKLAVVDHITSPTAVMLPVKQLVEVCHRHDVIVIIDGAHAPGMLSLDLQDIDADFYTGNLHKWVYTPRSCAFLWRNPARSHPWFRPLVTSAYEDKGLPMAFANEGTKDDIPYLCAIDGIGYYKRLGGKDAILAYTVQLRQRATAYLEKAWDTTAVELPNSMVAPNLRVIRLPPLPKYNDYTMLDLMKLFLDRFSIQTYFLNSQMVRISVQVYNVMEDYIKLADAVLTLAKET